MNPLPARCRLHPSPSLAARRPRRVPPAAPFVSMLAILVAGGVTIARVPAQAAGAGAAPEAAGGAAELQAGDQAPGTRAGTWRWIVTFGRGLDLEPLRLAIRAGAGVPAVDAITADLERRAAQEMAPFAAAVTRQGGVVTHRWWLIPGCAIEATAAAVAELRRLPNVRDIEPDRRAVPLIRTSTDANNHAADALQAAGVKGLGATVAIMDTGLDASSATTGRPHATFFRNGDPTQPVGPGLGGSRLLANVAIGAVPADNGLQHGTGVAGIAAGARWNTAPTSDDGHAPEANVVGYAITDDPFSGKTNASTMVSAWQAIVRDRLRYGIVAANNSYTGDSCSLLSPVQQALDAAAWVGDLLVTTSAGNSGGDTTYSQPTANGLAVGAVMPTQKTVASWSAYGPLLCERTYWWPDLVACGVSTVMPAADNERSAYVNSGTSMAAPQVCGAAALVRSVNPSLTAQETKAILLATTEDVSAQNPGLDRNHYGLGFLRDDLAVAVARTPGAAFTRGLPTAGPRLTFQIGVQPGLPYRAVIVWPRRLGTSTSAQWSDLALRALDGATQAQLAQSDDKNQLYEKVSFVGPSSGSVTLEVFAVRLESGAPIEFALAHTGTPIGWVAGAFTPFGAACPGATTTPSLETAGLPMLGGRLRVQLRQAAAQAAAVFLLGASRTNFAGLPLPAALPGAPGCMLHVAANILVPTAADGAGEAVQLLQIPADPALLGQSLYAQWLAADPVNALGFVATRGGQLTIGGQQ